MRRIYAVQFEVDLQGNRPGDVSGQLALYTKRWVSYWYKLRLNKDVNLSEGNIVLEPENEHTVEVVEGKTETGETLWELKWLRPSFYEETLMWEAECTIAQVEEKVEFTVILRLGSRAHFIAPPRYFLKTPYLVKEILDNFDCHIGGEKIRRNPEIIEVENTEPFVEFLSSNERRLPIVLFSTDNYSEHFLTNPELAADKIAGLAHVYLFKNKWASFKFTDMVGKPASCYNGAVRVYWPGSRDSALLVPDRPFLPDEVKFGGEKIGDRILMRLARVSAFHFSDTGTTQKAREAVENEREKNIESMREKVVSGKAEKEELENYNKEIFEEYSKGEEKIKSLTRNIEELTLRSLEVEEDNTRLEEENQRLKENIALIYTHKEKAELEQVLEESGEGVKLDSVKDALAKAKEDFADFITVLPNAEDNAAESDFRQPDKVYAALWAVQLIACDYFESKRVGKSMGDFRSSFAEKGFDYKPKESTTTMGKHGTDRTFLYKGEPVVVERHISIGSGSPKDCLQIYFHVDDSDEKFVICHCGRHLPFASHRT